MNKYIEKDILLQIIDELVYSDTVTPEDILDAVRDIIADIYCASGVIVVPTHNSFLVRTVYDDRFLRWVKAPEKENGHE